MRTVFLQMKDRNIVIDGDRILHIDRPNDKKSVEIFIEGMENPIVADFETNKEADDAFEKIIEIWTDLPLDAVRKSHIFKGVK